MRMVTVFFTFFSVLNKPNSVFSSLCMRHRMLLILSQVVGWSLNFSVELFELLGVLPLKEISIHIALNCVCGLVEVAPVNKAALLIAADDREA